MSDWTIDYYTKDAHRAIDELNAACKKTEESFKTLTGSKVMKFKEYPFNVKYVDSYSSLDQAKGDYDSKFEACKIVREENLKILENNQKIRDAVFKLLEDLGINKEYTDYHPRTPKRKAYNWPSEICSFIPVDDGWKKIEEKYTNGIAEINKKKKEQEIKVREEEVKKAAQLAQEIRTRTLGVLASKYGLSIESDYEEILSAILDKNKYLELGYGLLQNRLDWLDGPDRASGSLQRFKIESETDQKICNDILEHIENWDGDGRIFRDCVWNYERLFEMVGGSDPSLYADYQKMEELREEY